MSNDDKNEETFTLDEVKKTIEGYVDENAPKIGEYWKLRNNEGSYPFVIIEEVDTEEPDVVWVKYFKSSSRGTESHFKEEKLFILCIDELGKKVAPPKEKKKGKRTFYFFEENLQDDFE